MGKMSVSDTRKQKYVVGSINSTDGAKPIW